MISTAGAFPVDSCFLCLLSLILHLKTRVLLLVPIKNNVTFNYHKNYVHKTYTFVTFGPKKFYLECFNINSFCFFAKLLMSICSTRWSGGFFTFWYWWWSGKRFAMYWYNLILPWMNKTSYLWIMTSNTLCINCTTPVYWRSRWGGFSGSSTLIGYGGSFLSVDETDRLQNFDNFGFYNFLFIFGNIWELVTFFILKCLQILSKRYHNYRPRTKDEER